MKKKILLVDDNASVRETLGRVLESENYMVVTSKNGREAGAKFIAESPDLVLLDITLPDQDGWKVFESIRSANRQAPVIVITAKPHQYDRAMGMRVDAIMEKPLNLPCLLNAIADFLAESEQERIDRQTSPDFRTLFLTSGLNAG
jgi:DNA-binding response OmpR family regulator